MFTFCPRVFSYSITRNKGDFDIFFCFLHTGELVLQAFSSGQLWRVSRLCCSIWGKCSCWLGRSNIYCVFNIVLVFCSAVKSPSPSLWLHLKAPSGDPAVMTAATAAMETAPLASSLRVQVFRNDCLFLSTVVAFSEKVFWCISLWMIVWFRSLLPGRVVLPFFWGGHRNEWLCSRIFLYCTTSFSTSYC